MQSNFLQWKKLTNCRLIEARSRCRAIFVATEQIDGCSSNQRMTRVCMCPAHCAISEEKVDVL